MDGVKGKVLLVGDGDFSFTVAYATKLKARTDVTIHTSTLLCRSELFELHKNAEANVAVLKELGVRVLFEVDATKLSRCAAVKDLDCDVIIFNFPHTGGKSNIKKNRALLKDFFHSADEILHADAQVIVTLCRGQGGTPRDRPVREWPDSWQVVAQAAYSGWVARRIQPFSIERYPQYGSTGFRSLDRNFYTKDSFSHFFSRAPAIYPQTHGVQSVNGVAMPNAVARRLEARERILVEHHPVRMVSKYLHALLSDTILSSDDSAISNMIFNEPEMCTSGTFVSEHELKLEEHPKKCVGLKDKAIACEKRSTRQNIDEETTEYKECSVESGKCTEENSIKSPIPVSLSEWNSGYVVYPRNSQESVAKGDHTDDSLISTLLDSPAVTRDAMKVMAEGHVYAAQGHVFRRSFLDTANTPHAVAHELMIMCHVHKTELEEKRQVIRNNITTCLERLLPDKGSFTEAAISKNELPLYYKSHLHDAHKFTYNYCSSNLFSTAACNQVKAQGKPDPDLAESLHQQQVSRTVGFIGFLDDKWLKELQLDKQDEKLSLMCAIFDLDNLALARYDIPDHRLLWSENPAFLDQFKPLAHNEAAILEPLSQHPPLWRHDLSFWEKRGVSVDEVRLMDIIADTAGDAVNRVLLVNVWTDPDTGLTSKCYRTVYQSLDRPLSHRCAHDIQNAIRLKVAEVLGVTLR